VKTVCTTSHTAATADSDRSGNFSLAGRLSGWILLVIGVVLLIFGQVGRPVGGRRYWY
jgi:hypothetical protein